MKKSNMYALMGLTLVVGAAFVACGGSSGSPISQSVTQSAPASPTPRPVSVSDLPDMVITAGDLAAPYSDFVLDPAKSGVQARDVVINNACDPEKAASELVSTNWVAEYASEWGPPEGTTAAPDGTFLIASTVDLFQDEASAAAAFHVMIADMLQEANSQCQGVNIGSVEAFSFPTIGDESWGANETATSSGLTFVVTGVVSRRGQVVVSEAIGRLNNVGLPDEATRLAGLIIQRMNG